MMIHEKLMSGQFLLDLKNDHAASLLHAHSHQAHHSLHAMHSHHHQQPSPSPPMASNLKMDLYSAYAYQQHLQQHLIGSVSHVPDNRTNTARSPHQHHHNQQHNQHHQSPFVAPVEVLDLSRRCEPMETPPRKTPSPYQSTSSFGTGSPALSPTNTLITAAATAAAAQQSLIPANLLYSAQAQHEPAITASNSLPLPGSLAALYPGLYYPNAHIKPESTMSITPPPPPTSSSSSATLTQPAQSRSPVDVMPKATTTNTLLQTFASAAAVAAASVSAINNNSNNNNMETSTTNEMTPLSPVGSTNNSTTKSTSMATTPTSSTSATAALAALDTKTTRPFKAFPRDPLVIAANFAAADVLLDNPRVERYTEYRKRVLEQIRNSNGGARTITNPKMRRTNSRSGSINDGCSSSTNNSENDERSVAAEESSDCDSNAGNFEKVLSTNETATTASTTSASASAAALMNGGSQVKDAAYYERRRKNNAAAKKSRDRRRIKEDEIAIRAAYLERQNIELLCQIDALKAQLAAYTSSKVGA